MQSASALPAKINSLKTEPATRTSGLGHTWKVDAVTASDLHTLLSNLKGTEGRVALVDCQSDNDNYGKQLRGAIHLYAENFGDARTNMKRLYEEHQTEFEQSVLMNADLVVFYCKQGTARSPSALSAYRDLREALLKQKKKLRNQKLVLLNGGIEAYCKVQGNATKTQTWASPHKTSKAMIALDKEDQDEPEFLMTEP